MAGRSDSKLRQILEIELDITCDHQVHKAVGIVVAKRRPRGPPLVEQSRFFSGIAESAVAIVAIENHPFGASNQHVRPAIIVIVGNRAAHRPAGISHTNFVGDIGKSSVMIVAIEGALGFLAAKSHGDTRCIGEINIQPAVLIVVEQKHTTAHGFHDVLLFRRNCMLKLNPTGRSHIAEVESEGWFELFRRFL